MSAVPRRGGAFISVAEPERSECSASHAVWQARLGNTGGTLRKRSGGRVFNPGLVKGKPPQPAGILHRSAEHGRRAAAGESAVRVLLLHVADYNHGRVEDQHLGLEDRHPEAAGPAEPGLEEGVEFDDLLKGCAGKRVLEAGHDGRPRLELGREPRSKVAARSETGEARPRPLRNRLAMASALVEVVVHDATMPALA